MTPAVHPGSRGEGGPLATRLAASEEPAQGLEIVGRTFDLKTLRVHFGVEFSEGQHVLWPSAFIRALRVELATSRSTMSDNVSGSFTDRMSNRLNSSH